MECVICKSEDVPVVRSEEEEIYLSKVYVPFLIGECKSELDTSNLFRARLYFPKDKPLCKKCRKKIAKQFWATEEGN